MEHADIIKACLKGDKKAQRSLIDGFSPLLMGICLRYSRNRTEAEDALQEAWIRIFKGMEQYREEGFFKAWICRITVHAAIRNSQRYRDTSQLDGHTNPHQLHISPEIIPQLNAEDLLGIINGLPERHATVFKLYVVDGFQHKEIAELLEINESTSRVYLTKAREALRILIADPEKIENQ